MDAQGRSGRRVEPLVAARTRPIDELDPADDLEAAAIGCCEDARRFIATTPFCSGIAELRLGYCVPGVITVALVSVERRTDGPQWLWVVVGDVPPAILSSTWMTTPARALEGYLRSMRAWARAARAGESVDGLIHVNIPATREWAEALDGRLDLIDERLLPEARAGVHLSE